MDNKMMIDFSKRLRDLLVEKKLTSSKDFFEQIGIPRTSISNWLNLTRSPQADSLVLIAKFFNVSVDFLLRLEYELGNKLYASKVSPKKT